MSKIGVIWGGPPKIGDLIVSSHFPENYYKTTGHKLIDVEKLWIFDYNPYVIRGEQPDEVIKLWKTDLPPAITQAHALCAAYDIKCYLNHPRLYQYENIRKSPYSIILHSTGVTVGAVPFKILNYISEKYKEYNIFQLGLSTDFEAPNVFVRNNLGYWQICKYIASSFLFIGIDSGLMHIASAYSIPKKVILVNKTEEELSQFVPLYSEKGKNCGWVGPTCDVYNCFEKDIGLTKTYLQI